MQRYKLPLFLKEKNIEIREGNVFSGTMLQDLGKTQHWGLGRWLGESCTKGLPCKHGELSSTPAPT